MALTFPMILLGLAGAACLGLSFRRGLCLEARIAAVLLLLLMARLARFAP